MKYMKKGRGNKFTEAMNQCDIYIENPDVCWEFIVQQVKIVLVEIS